MLEFRVLGPLDVIGPDGPVVLRGVKRRGLLAYLLANRGQVVPADRVVDALDDGDGGRGALGTVQTYVSQLRKVLPPGAEIVTEPSGYVLRTADDSVDAGRFEAGLRAAATEGDSGARLRLLDGALGLWRGTAFEEFSWPWAVTERSRLERRRVDALCQRAEVRLERGEHLDALSELDALTAEYPLDERLCGQRMLAAYRAGRQAEALRAFQDLRRNLADELGLDPGPDLVELERRMLDHDPALRAGAVARVATSPTAPAVVPRASVTPDATTLTSGFDEAEKAKEVDDADDVRRAVRVASALTLGLATVAVLITDLVGSASMRTSLGAHRADELERWHENIVSKAVADYHGTIVKRLGDGAMAVFTTATDAVAAAGAIQTRLARESRAQAASLQVRIGVSAGEVVVEENDVRGLPPTEAARLCARAEGGQILASQLVQHLASARSAATFRPFGAFELKGLPGPAPLYEVPWPVGGDDRITMPAALQPIPGDFAFVGRAHELDQLADCWARATATSAFAAVLVTGEAGAGKSRLTSEFTGRFVGESDSELDAEAVGRAPIVLHGRCDEVAGYPFQPIAEWLRHYLAHAAPASVGMVRARHGGQLSRLVPELVGAQAGPDPAHLANDRGDPVQLYDSVLGWLTLVSDGAPVLLVVDDLQWASRPTLAALRHLVTATPRFPGMLLATCRDDGVTDTDLLDGIGRPGGARVRRVAVGELTTDDVGAMLRETREPGSALRPALAREIHTESGGNALFVASLARQVESEELGRLQGTRRQVPPPERVMELVTRRLETVAPETVELLQQAAVSGTEFEFSLLRIVAGRDEDRLLDRLSEAVRTRYLVELPGTPLRYRFPHEVVRRALLETIPVSRRLQLHRIAARGLEQLGRAGDDRTVAALAYHFSEAAPLGEVDRAITYCRLAAEVATQQLAHDDAASWYEKALDVARAAGVSDDEHYELLLALGRAQVCAGHEDGRGSLFRAYRLAHDRRDATHAAEAVLSLNRGFFARTGQTDHEAVDALEATLALLDPVDSRTRAEVLAALASELVWAPDGDRRFDLSDAALAIARRVADPGALARVLVLRNMTILAPDTLQERTANCYELLGLAEEAQDETVRFDAAFHRGGTALEAGDADAANDMVDLAARAAHHLGQPRFSWQARLMQTAQAVFAGELSDAEFFADEALDLGRKAGQGNDAFVFHAEQLLEIRRWQGRLPEQSEQLRIFAGRPEWDFGFVITRYLYESGAAEEAARIYRRLVSGEFLPVRRDMLAAPTLYNLAFVATRERDKDVAAGLSDALMPFADSFANTTVAKPVGWHYLGMLAGVTGDLDHAVAHLRRAVHIHELVGAALFRAESEIELARILRTTGETDEADALLRSARAQAAARGAGLLVATVDALY